MNHTRVKRILVTGGLGFIGSCLVRRLATGGQSNIVVIDNKRRQCISSQDLPAGVEFRSGDIRNKRIVREVMAGVDTVYHLAAESTVSGALRDPEYTIDTNILGTHHVLAEANAAGVRRVIFASSREVYGDASELPVSEAAPLRPLNLYGASKAAGEMLCQGAAGDELSVVILRFSNVYGTGDHGRVLPLFIDAAKDGRPLHIFDSEKIVDFIHQEFAVDALEAAGNGVVPVGPVNVGSGVGVNLVQVAERVVSLCKSTSQIEIRPKRGPEVSRFIADISLAKALFGLRVPADPLQCLNDLI